MTADFVRVPIDTITTRVVKYNTPQGPTDVRLFVKQMMGTFKEAFGGDFSIEDNCNRASDYLHKLYDEVVFNGKTFKTTIPTVKSKSDAQELVLGSVTTIIPGVNAGKIYTLSDDIAWCLVIRGAKEDDEVRSQIHRFEANGKTVGLPVLTYKLFQACVTLLLCLNKFQQNVPPAKLNANIFRTCKIADSAPNKDNWAIHGHSGVNFVARYVHQVGAKDAQKRQLPPLEALLMMAYRADAARKNKDNADPWPTVRSIFQSTGMTESEMKTFCTAEKMKPSSWGSAFVGVSKGLSIAFANSMKSLEKETPSSSRTDRNKQDTERYDD